MNDLMYYLSYSFVQNAILVGVLTALSSSFIGTVLVLKRYSFIGDSLSHVAFCAAIVATLVKISPAGAFTVPITVLFTVLLLKGEGKRKISGDASLALISVVSLALGYVFINVFSSSANVAGDVCSTLFGSTSILTLDPKDVYLSIILSAVVIIAYILFYNRIVTLTFDEDFMKASGLKVNLYKLILSAIIACVIVLGMDLVGSLLITALIIFPTIASMQVFKNFKAVVVSAAIFSAMFALFGILFSIMYSTPVGCTIVLSDMVGFLIFYVIGRIKK